MKSIYTMSLRHLQLTHYRVNELGDIQTELPVHNGLTDFGAAVIRRCNQVGLVVDVAHGTVRSGQACGRCDHQAFGAVAHVFAQ